MKVVKLSIPSDKSISHRAVMLASISEGVTRINNILIADDIKCTVAAFKAMGIKIALSIKKDRASAVVYGKGLYGFKKPHKPLYAGNSGTTMRILSGILAGQNFKVVLKADESLSNRPMQRIIEPLRKMGAEIYGSRFPSLSLGTGKVQGSTPNHRGSGHGFKDIYPPLTIHGTRLKPISYKSPIPSAQVKSCVLLAGLYADGITSVSEPIKSRDHTERMLRIFGCKVHSSGCKVSVKGIAKLISPCVIDVPGDISSAAFFIVAGCILSDTKIVIKNVGLNPTRTGVMDILKRMGANIEVQGSRFNPEPQGFGAWVQGVEPVGDIVVRSSRLKGVRISPEEVAKAIDEIPIIMVAACFAEGETVIEGIGELRVKETDRIKSMVTNLCKMGANIEVQGSRFNPEPQGFGAWVQGERVVIRGGRTLRGTRVSSFGDHRTAMSMLIAGLGCKGRLVVEDTDCISKSFPGFKKLLSKLSAFAKEETS